MGSKHRPVYQYEFTPGCFDYFDGTQEELDHLTYVLQKRMEAGDFNYGIDIVNDIDIKYAQAIEDFLNPVRILH